MTYKEAKDFLEGCNQYAGELTLKPLQEMLRRLGNPENSLSFVHIAGTNGKGSVLAFVSTVLQTSGYRVGRYLSPTIFSYRERMQVNGEPISQEDLIRLTKQIQETGKQMLSEGLGHPTMFEAETALAFLYFAEQKCDLVVLECGRGGLMDATNVISHPLLCVFTSISMDHIGVLGNTLEEIAENKAGIIKAGCTVVTIKQKPDAMRAISKHAEDLGCEVILADPSLAVHQKRGLFEQSFDYKEFKQVKISLSGEYQFMNAALSIEVLLALQKREYQILEDDLRRGMQATVWDARFTVIAKEPLFIIDGAHNPDAAQKLKETIENYLPGKRLIFIIGVLSDKEYEVVVQKTVPLASEIITIMTPNNPRALSAEKLAETIKKYNSHVQPAKDIGQAVSRAYQLAKKDDVILAFGSLSYLGELAKYVQKRSEGNE